MPRSENAELLSLTDYRAENPPPVDRISNVREVTTGGKTVEVPARMGEIVGAINRATGGWPARIGDELFVPEGDNDIRWIPTGAALTAWLASATGEPPLWRSKDGFLSAAEVLAELRATAYEFKSIEKLPHVPPMADTYYACEPLTPGPLDALEEFLRMFRPETPADHTLLLAMFATPLWGGPGGARPLFMLTAARRGCGKTTVAEKLGDLYRGRFDFRPSDTADIVKARLLTPSARSKRIVVLDNIKSDRLSSDWIESLVTASEISGRGNWVGERTRPNTLTWTGTMNGVSLCTDLSQRAVVIRMAMPRYHAGWEDRVDALIADRRTEILAGLAALMRRRTAPCEQPTRWSMWDHAVLARLRGADEARRLIAQRQSASNAEEDESSLIISAIRDNLRNPSITQFVRSDDIRKWWADASGERVTAVGLGRRLGQIADAGGTPLRRSLHNGDIRGWQWVVEDPEEAAD